MGKGINRRESDIPDKKCNEGGRESASEEGRIFQWPGRY